MRFATYAFALMLFCAAHAQAAIDYARDILPILSDNCYHCHGPDENGRKAKLRLDTKEGALGKRKDGSFLVVPGKSAESELIRRVVTTNLDDKMPPPDSNRRLTPQQEKLLAKWVDEGANWGMHWAFVPPTVKPLPKAAPREKNTIDRFIHARLTKEGLSMSPEAAKETLLRRVTLDLTGIPPTVKELDEFLADKSTNAFERVVDRLLASPRFGERMATEWLDLARYADTHGYQMDRFRPMWPYRNWVIEAFNRNLPFDQFVKWQLAGDLLPSPTKEQRLATAFNRLHNQNEEGGIVEEEYRVAYVADRVNTVGTAFLGLTTECARCHDHKYDPISQKDFYSLFAFFQNIDESGQTSYFTDSMPVPTLLLTTDEQDRKLEELKNKISSTQQKLAAARKKSSEAAFKSWLGTRTNAGVQGLVGFYNFDEIVSNKVANLVGTNSARGHDNPTLISGKHGQAVALTGENGFTFPGAGHFGRADAFSISLWLRTAAHAERLVVLHHSKAPIDAGSRGYELILERGKVAFGLHHMWPRNSLKVASKATVPTNEWTHVTVTYDGSSRASGVTLFINGKASPQETIRDGLFKDITYGGGEPDLAIGHRFRDNGFKDGAVDDLRIFNRALTRLEAAEVAEQSVEKVWNLAASGLSAADVAALKEHFDSRINPETTGLAKELQELRREEARLVNPIPEAMVMEEMAQTKPAHVLKRGAYDAPGEPVTADTPKVLPPFPKDAPRNRLGLAQWLLQPDHPLTARVTVNRAWQMMFGRGIVETVDNFGSQGAQPSHPELLDWLAHEFAHTGWDMKRLLKLIAMSETYRQSSKGSPALIARDPHNELLARGPSHRLSAEMIRDQALSLSGLLVEKIGGPSVKPYQPDGIWEIAMGRPKYDRGKGDDLYRRSLYTYWKRTVPPPAMVTFDAADRSYCSVKRQSTSTPLQALALLNDVQLVEAARILGERMIKEGGATLDGQLNWVFRATTMRVPSDRELTILKALYHEQHEHFAGDNDATKKFLSFGEKKNDPALTAPQLAAAASVAQTLLNHDSSVWKR